MCSSPALSSRASGCSSTSRSSRPRVGRPLARHHVLAGGRPRHARRRARELARGWRPAAPARAARGCSPFGPAGAALPTTSSRAGTRSDGGLLACGPAGRSRSPSAPTATRYELSVTVEEYLPRLAARVGAPWWTGVLYAKGQSPFHAAVSRRYFELLARGRAREGDASSARPESSAARCCRSSRPTTSSSPSRAPPRRRSGRPLGRGRRRLRRGRRRRARQGAEVVYYLVHSLGVARLRATGSRRGGERRARGRACRREADRLPRRARRRRPDASPHLRSRRETGERLAPAAFR